MPNYTPLDDYLQGRTIEEAIMGAAQNAIDSVKITYHKLYTWQPVESILRYNADKGLWEEIASPNNSVWRWYGNPNDKSKSIFNPRHGDMWYKVSE